MEAVDHSMLAEVDPSFWAMRAQIRLQTGVFSFDHHEYQQEMMSSRSRRRCFMKGTQLGGTEGEVLVDLHGMIFGRYPQGVLHLMPTGDDVGEFSKARFGPLIAANKSHLGKYVKDTDTSSLKKVGTAFLYLRGARLSQKLDGDVRESSKLRGISVDRIVYDEFDLMDEDVREKAFGRMGHSLVKEEIFLSNPVLPDSGIDHIYKQSDQRHWFRTCRACGHETCAELSFPACVKYYPQGQTVDGKRGYVACSHCGRPLGIAPGHWVAQYPDRSEFMAGYQLSQLTSIYNDPAEIFEAFNEPPQGNLADVYRLRLGLPYAAAEDRLLESQIYSCCGNCLPVQAHQGPAAMGVDVGKIKHVVIGLRVGQDQYEILRATTVSDWNDIHDLAKRYNVRSGVVDIRPYEDSARAFQKSEPYPIYLCEYSETMPTGPHYDPNSGIVKVNRTEIFDRTHRMIITDGMVRLPRLCDEVKEFARQMCNAAKFLDRNKRTGTDVYRYKAVGDGADHFRNAFNYFALAASGGKIGRVGVDLRSRPARAVNNFRVGVN